MSLRLILLEFVFVMPVAFNEVVQSACILLSKFEERHEIQFDSQADKLISGRLNHGRKVCNSTYYVLERLIQRAT
jgi:hypothetical protein